MTLIATMTIINSTNFKIHKRRLLNSFRVAFVMSTFQRNLYGPSLFPYNFAISYRTFHINMVRKIHEVSISKLNGDDILLQ